ncbi:unnamed protein product, partial [Effrenium voratum]
VADEEATGFRAANLLMSLGVRGMPVPEISHPQWGDYGRACESSGLTLPTLKLTLLCNFGRGPFRSGRFGYNVSKAAELFMSEVTDEFLESLTERIGLDQGLPPEEMDTHGQEADDDAADDGQDAVEEDAEAEGEGPNPDDVEHRSVLLTRRHFFVNRTSGKHMMSLGFFRWGVMTAYLQLCPDTVPSPNWAFNAGIGEQSPWNYVPVEILSPGELPANAPFNHTVSFKVTGPPEDLLVAAIRNKCPLEVFHCRRLLKMLKKPEPKQGQGSGKNGGVTKRDLLKALIAYAIPDATPAEANDLLGGILGQKVGGIEEAPEVLLELTSRVEPKEAQHFDKLRKDAVNELQVRAQKARLRGKHQKENTEATDVHGDDAETTTADPPAEPAQPDCEPSSSSKVERPKTLEFDPDAPPAPSAGVPRMPSLAPRAIVSRTRAPGVFVKMLPSVAGLYVKWMPQHHRVTLEFQKGFSAKLGC